MPQTIIYSDTPLDPLGWETYTSENICEFLTSRFKTFPKTCRIYKNSISEENDVTPKTDEQIAYLQNLDETLYVVIYPALSYVVIAIVSIVASYLLTPKIPSTAERNIQSGSPNNSLSDRKNRVNVNGRIPDIFGTVRSTPDLIASPYKIFKNHQEVEYAAMCIGIGEYYIPENQIKDGNTLISDISGASIEVYGPYSSLNSGDDAQLVIGTPIDEVMVISKKLNSVNGQVLRAPNINSVSGNNDIKFVYPNEVHINSASDTELDEFFEPGDTLSISNSGTSTNELDPELSLTTSMRFYVSGLALETEDTDDFEVGDTIILTNAVFTNAVASEDLTVNLTGTIDVDTTVDFVAETTVTSVNNTLGVTSGLTISTNSLSLDLSGTYTILSKTTIDGYSVLVFALPSALNSDWSLITSGFTSNRTPFKNCTIKKPAQTTSFSLNGVYTILSVSSNYLTLSSPSSVNSGWTTLNSLSSTETGFLSPILQTTGSNWVGPFILDHPDLNRVFNNFVALNGLYKDDGKKQIRLDIEIEIELTPLDSLGDAIGPSETFEVTIEGSSSTKSTRAVTLKSNPTFTGKCAIRARRVTSKDLDFEGNVVDEIKWRDTYSISDLSETDFGNVTTVYSINYATSGALSIKERKLNMLVTRMLPQRISGSTFTETNVATNKASDIISFISLDPKIGNRKSDEIDFDSIYDTLQEVEDYFGTEMASEFSYTFDSDNITYEEMVSSIAQAVYCTAYRRGNVIKLNFEKATENSLLLFNHRNKLPGSEKRTFNFGNQEHDGVEYEWIDPDDDSLVTLYIPQDKSAANPKKIETIGIRNSSQAYFHAWRIWNKLQYQNTEIEFDATQESDLLINNDRVLISNNITNTNQEGEVMSQSALTLKLSQSFEFEEGENYVMFLQHTDGTVEMIPILEGPDSYSVILTRAPKASLSLDVNNYARALYQITNTGNPNACGYLITEKDTHENFTSTLRAINYSFNYYFNDNLTINLPFGEYGYSDLSVNAISVSTNNTASLYEDLDRGIVHKGISGTDYLVSTGLDATASYTKCIWVNKEDTTTIGNLLSSLLGTDEVFWISGVSLRAGHSGNYSQVSATITDGEWVHCVVSYNAESTTMKLFINGVLSDTNDSVAQRTLGELMLLGLGSNNSLIGMADNLLCFNRELEAEEILYIYNTTRT